MKNRREEMNNPNKIIDILKSAGFRAAFLPFNAAIEQITAVNKSMSGSESSPQYAKNAAEHFRSNQPPDIPFEPLSFLVVASPSPPARLTLTIDGKTADIPIPPIYINQGGRHRINEVLASAAAGFQTAHTKGISFKLLTVMSGLGSYGRNNICYVNGLGSHCLLAAFYTDVPFDGAISDPLKFMPECDACTVCREKCPTHAIIDSPVIDADLCINKYTYRLDPIPENIPKTAFNALIGCWLCQESCPVNMALPEKEAQTLELDEVETQAFLAYETAMPPDLEQKLRQFFKNDHLFSVAGRNAALALQR